MVDGQTIEWEFQKLFDGISDDKIEARTLQEFERHQDERMKLNAYMVRDEVVKRIDGAPCLKEEIVAYPPPDDPFFFNKAEIYKHHTASNPNGNPKVPGIFYFQKITTYIQKHYHVGQLHMHFLKDRCDESGSGSVVFVQRAGLEKDLMAYLNQCLIIKDYQSTIAEVSLTQAYMMIITKREKLMTFYKGHILHLPLMKDS